MDTLVLHLSERIVHQVLPTTGSSVPCLRKKVMQDLSGDEARDNSRPDGCTHFLDLFGSSWNKETDGKPLDYPKTDTPALKWQARSTAVMDV